MVLRRRLRIAIGGVIGCLLALALAARVDVAIGPFKTTLAGQPSLRGETVVKMAPLGTIEVDTHDAPFAVELSVDELSVEQAERIAADPSVLDGLEDELSADARAAIRGFLLRSLLVGLLGGVLGAVALVTSWRSAAAGLLCAAIVLAVIGGTAARSFDADAVSEPRYTGLLARAPQAVGDVEAIIERFGDYRAQLTELVGNVATLYAAGQQLPTFRPGASTTRILHVSDIHLNPQAFDLIAELVDQFDADVVVDSGDLTDWGTETETAVIELIGDLDVPYVYVRGNHDSRAVQAAVAEQPNAVVLDGTSEVVAGVRFFGIGDPRYTPNKDQPTGKDVERFQAEAYATQVRRQLAVTEPPEADVAVIHDPRSAAELGGQVPLVLAGHFHDADIKRLGDDTVLLAEGSTGGAGLRALQKDEPEPLTATVVYLDARTQAPIALDRVRVAGLGETSATIERHVLAPPSAPAPPRAERGPGPR